MPVQRDKNRKTVGTAAGTEMAETRDERKSPDSQRKYGLTMKNDTSASSEAARHRLRTEEQLRAESPFSGDRLLSGDIDVRKEEERHRLFHELDVLQVELEMQVAELRQAAEEKDAAVGVYRDLYDFAPVGFFTLDRAGTIRAVNLTGANLLGVERSQLIGQRRIRSCTCHASGRHPG
jgi:PAS domain-containing protein